MSSPGQRRGKCGHVMANFDTHSIVVGPFVKIKTGFRGFETERNPGFRKCTDI